MTAKCLMYDGCTKRQSFLELFSSCATFVIPYVRVVARLDFSGPLF
jgi:hypothetical protein